MNKILLVEDDFSLGQTLKDRLSQNYFIDWAESGEQAWQLVQSVFAQEKLYDLIILDVGLPDCNGFELIERLKTKINVPFIFLTAQADAESRLQGYQLGADEFIPKPFHLKELLMRIEHVLKMHHSEEINASVSVYKIKNVEINFLNLIIINENNEKFNLSSSEMKVLQKLIQNTPLILDRDQIMNEVWGLESQLSHRSIDNIIVKIRGALSSAGGCIRTVRGRGYQWLVND